MSGHDVSLLSLHYPPDSTGVAPYSGALAAGLAARGHRVAAYVAHPFYPEWRIRAGYGQWRRTENVDGVVVRRFLHYVPRPPRGVRRLLSEISFGLRLAFGGSAAHSVVVAVSPALFATALVALRIGLRRSRPTFIVWVQDLYALGMTETKEGGGLSAKIAEFVERVTLRRADRVVVIHPRFARYLVEELGIDPERVAVIRNWTHLAPSAPMSRSKARAVLGWRDDVRLVVHTGNMGAKQGLDNVVAAARLADQRRLPVEFVLVGDGGERERLEELARGVERIRFVDPLDDTRYRCALAAADCLLVNELPGVAAMAVPSKLTSYFDAGRPIVAATDLGGITAEEVSRSGAGIAVPAGDPEALLATALRLSNDHDGALAHGAAGQRYRQEVLTEEAAITAFDQVIRDAVVRGSASSRTRVA